MQSKREEIKATKWLSRDEFNKQQDVERERYRKELQEKGSCKVIKVIKWLVFGLVAYLLFGGIIIFILKKPYLF